MPDVNTILAAFDADLAKPGLNPRITAQLQAARYQIANDPEIRQAIASGQTVDIQRGKSRFRIINGRPHSVSTGSLVTPLLAAGLVAAGGMGLAALQAAGAGAGAAGGGVAGGGLGTGALAAGATVPGAGAVSGIGAVGAGSGLFGGLLSGRDLVDIGLDTAGNLIAGHQTSKAVDAQVQASREALALQERIYNQQRSDLGPWRQAGQGALSQLMHGLGVNPAQDGPPSPQTGPLPGGPAPQAVPQPGALAPYAGPPTRTPGWSTGLVQMRAPTGEVQAVRPEQVAHFEELGARRL